MTDLVRYPFRNDDLRSVVDSQQSAIRGGLFSNQVRQFVVLSQAEYDALTETDAGTLYFIRPAPPSVGVSTGQATVTGVAA